MSPATARSRVGRWLDVDVPAGTRMDDGLEPGDNWQLLQNVYYKDGGLWQRPGWGVVTASALTSAMLLHPHRLTTGEQVVFVFTYSPAKIYRLSWTSLTAMSVTDVTPAGYAPAGQVYAVSFGNEIVVSGAFGTELPYRLTNLTATPITKTNITLDSAVPTTYSRCKPTVYGGKVFFLVTSDATEIVWSEEGDASIGYKQTGYNNTWEVRQNSTDYIQAIHGANAGLVYFRNGSIGQILGTVSSEFQTTATHDGISVGVGIGGLHALLEHDDQIWFIDERNQPHVLQLGGGIPKNLSHPFSRTIAAEFSLAGEENNGVWFVWQPELDLILMGGFGGTFLVFDAQTGEARGVWTTALASGGFTVPPVVCEGYNLAPTLIAVGGTTLYQQLKVDDANAGNDAGSLIPVSVVGPAVNYDRATEKRFDKLTASLRVTTDSDLVRDVRLDYRTNRADYGTAQTVSVTAPYDGAEVKATVGTNGFGRWMRPRYRNSASTTNDGKHAFTGFRVEAIEQTQSPGIK